MILELLATYWPFLLLAAAFAVAVIFAWGDHRALPPVLDEHEVARAGRPDPTPIDVTPVPIRRERLP